MKPDYERAATMALVTLLDSEIHKTPISPLPLLKRRPGVIVMTFAEVSNFAEMDRDCIIGDYGANQDAVTFYVNRDKVRYLVFYNQQLPMAHVQRALARELGHIVLGHDGTRPAPVRDAEAVFFAHHLLCPRPLIHAIQAAGVPVTVEVLGNVTGCYEKCLTDMRCEPGVHVDPDLNRCVRDRFSEYLRNYLEYIQFLTPKDASSQADFGAFMDGYEE